MSKNKYGNRLEKYLRDTMVEGMVLANQDLNIVDKWKDFIKTLPVSEDPFMLSKNRYKARMYYVGFSYKFLINFNAFFKLMKIKTLKTINSMFKKDYKNSEEYNIKNTKKQDMIIQARDDMSIDDIFPEELYKEFPQYATVPVSFSRTYIFNKDLKKLYKELCRKNPFSFNYQLLALKELALHSYTLENYDPRAVIVYANERNLFSPILKDFYERNGKEFISFMHGTLLFQLITVFSAFSRYYIWDKEYIKMFKEDLHFDVNEYIVHTPKKNSYSFGNKNSYDKDITYYISGHTDKSHKRIAKLIELLKEKNIKLVVRPHPRREFDQNIYNKEDLENLDVDIFESMDNSEYILGVVTTVIEQAYFGGKKTILDDLTNKEEFHLLQEKKYLMLTKVDNKRIILLSQYLKDKGIDIEELFPD